VKIRYILDTHALIWSVLSPDRLGAQAYRAISLAAPGELAITSATIIELGRLIDSDQIDLNSRHPSDIFGDALAYNSVLPTSLEAATKAPTLGLPHADPFDRLIVAEALVLGVPLITKDGNITDSDTVCVLW